MNKIIAFLFLNILCNNMSFICAQNTHQDSMQAYNHRAWDSVTEFKLTVQMGPGTFSPSIGGDFIYAPTFRYTFDNPNGKISPSWKSTRSISIGIQGKVNIKNSPLSPYITAQAQRGFMSLYVFDTFDNQKAEARLKGITQMYAAAGISLDFKYLSFGGGYGLGAVWGGKLSKSLYPYDLAVIKNNQFNWVSHFIHGPELFIGAHYKKFGLYYTAFYGFSQNIGFAEGSKVSFYSNRLSFNYTLFDKRLKGKSKKH